MDANTQRPIELTINATEQGFADWLNSYGKAAQGRDFIARGMGWDMHHECGGQQSYGMIHPLNPRESIFVEVESLAADRTRLKVMFCSMTGEPSPESEQYFAALLVAIQVRFGTHPSTQAEDDRDLVRRAQYIKRTSGDTWDNIAKLVGVTPEWLRKLRKRYGEL